MNWTYYPDQRNGAWAEHGSLVLIAHHTGSWSVYDRTSKVLPRSSSMAVIIPNVEQNIQAAMAHAERNAHEMLQP
jgi:hypothetical protein